MHITPEVLENLLIGSDMVDKKTFTGAQKEALRLSHSLTEVLVGKKIITERHLIEIFQPYFNAPIVDLEKKNISLDILSLVSEAFAKSNNLAVFDFDKKTRTVHVAMLDPLDLDIIEDLRARLHAWVVPYITTQTSLSFALRQYKREIGKEFNEIISENVEKSLLLSGDADLSKIAEAIPIITILDTIIEHAFSVDASDIHFEPMAKEVLVRYRIDGILHEILSLPRAISAIFVARVKILAQLQIDEHRTPQDGRFRAEMTNGVKVDVRVNIMPVFHGEKVEMRLLKGGAQPLSFRDLGLSPESEKILREEAKKPHGMMLVTGPTGHGKTTTLYTVLHLLNRPEVNITTIEDPIEYEIPRVNQTQVNTKSGITFANGLRSLMRQNPDVIMVGEIRDKETVDISVHAALTGHLVLSTLHTNDASSALPRLLDMGAPAFLLSSTINVIIAQRLVRRIHTSCIESYKISPEVKKLITAQAKLSGDGHVTKKIPDTLYRGKGCNACGHSGFKGLVGIFEILRTSNAMKDLILKSVSSHEIRKLAIKEGMTTLFEDGLRKVQKGVTTIEEVLRVVRE